MENSSSATAGKPGPMTAHEVSSCILAMRHHATLDYPPLEYHCDVITEGVPAPPLFPTTPGTQGVPWAHQGQRRMDSRALPRREKERETERASSLELAPRHSSFSEEFSESLPRLHSPTAPHVTISGPIDVPAMGWEPEVGSPSLKAHRQRRGRAKERLQKRAHAKPCSLVSSPSASSSPTFRHATILTSSHDEATYGAHNQRRTSGAQCEADSEDLCELVYRGHAHAHACAPGTPTPTPPLDAPHAAAHSRSSHLRSAFTLTDSDQASAIGVGSWESSEPCSPFDLYPEAPAELLMWPPVANASGVNSRPRPRQWRSSSLDGHSRVCPAIGSSINNSSGSTIPRTEHLDWAAEGGNGWESGGAHGSGSYAVGGSAHAGEEYPRRSRLYRRGTDSPSIVPSLSQLGVLKAQPVKPESPPPPRVGTRPELASPPRVATKARLSPPPKLGKRGEAKGKGAEAEGVELFFFRKGSQNSEGAQDLEPQPSALQLKIINRLSAIKKMEQELKLSASYSFHRARDLLLPPHFSTQGIVGSAEQEFKEGRCTEEIKQTSRNLRKVHTPPPRVQCQRESISLQHLDYDAPPSRSASPAKHPPHAVADMSSEPTHPEASAAASVVLKSALRSPGVGKGSLNIKKVSFNAVVHVRRYHAASKH